MQEIWDWTKIVLLLGGAIVGLVGLMWYRTAKLANA